MVDKALTRVSAKLAAAAWMVLPVSCALAILFWQGVLPGMVHFSNDVTFGALSSPTYRDLSFLRGGWLDLHWLGAELPYLSPVTLVVQWALGPELFLKLAVPGVLLLCGCGGWCLCRSFGCGRAMSALGAILVALNGNYLSYAAWGQWAKVAGFALLFYALSVIRARCQSRPPQWALAVFAGLCAGFNMSEGFDSGAITSVLVFAYLAFQCLRPREGQRFFLSLWRMIRCTVLAVVASCGIALAPISDAVGAQIQQIPMLQQGGKEAWDWATQWSLPVRETIRFWVPGYFGQKTNSPSPDSYWGEIGRDPRWDREHQGLREYSGTGDYLGALVLLCCGWVVVSNLRPKPEAGGTADAPPDRAEVLFWAGCAMVCLLLAYGRHAPFYQFFYSLPLASSIRNPVKFLHPFTVSCLVLAVMALASWQRRYFGRALPDQPAPALQWGSVIERLRESAKGGDRTLIVLCLLSLGSLATLLAVTVLARKGLVASLDRAGWGDAATEMINSTITDCWGTIFVWCALTLVVGAMVAGCFRGRVPSVAGIALLWAVALADLGRAALPYVSFENWRERYSSNAVLDYLQEHTKEWRVSLMGGGPAILHTWHQHHFLRQAIPSLEFPQIPRVPADYELFTLALSKHPVRMLELTSCRYLFAPADELEDWRRQAGKNNTIAVAMRYRMDLDAPSQVVREDEHGPLALFEVNSAVPRYAFYTAWETHERESLVKRLADPAYDPTSTVLLERESLPAGVETTVGSGGTPSRVTPLKTDSYRPTEFVIKTTSGQQGWLVVTDRFTRHWRALVDGQPVPIAKAQGVMRAVSVPAGPHEVRFVYAPPFLPVLVSAVGHLLLALSALYWVRHRAI